ncbi:DUF4231 domain-containing protein [Streptomyces sp. S465]|uniref:DUF4231 domain-containing protein n=1 Tax=Streptomyces sp. S465 TaxID=2979468 RepID=UPI0022A8A4AD|nr:DUF4231 domain-containing protein [Streptomyces sp. S465]WAP60226.1 hypothetical protein N6H00_37615 [Streptomyces sp. S465]
MSAQPAGGGGGGSETGADGLQEELSAEIHREMRRWRVATVNYGVTYYLSRILLIVASAVVAADRNLSDGKGSFLVAWVPALALVVAVLTALDTWLKPQQKWQGFMESRDTLADLMVRSRHGLTAEEVREEFTALRRQHREKNIF